MRAVEQAYAHALDGIAREQPGLHRLTHALLHRADERGRNHAALGLVDELEARATLAVCEWLDRDLAVAELAPPAGLLLVAPVARGGPADRLPVGHARWLQRDLHAEALAQSFDDHLDMHLR